MVVRKFRWNFNIPVRCRVIDRDHQVDLSAAENVVQKTVFFDQVHAAEVQHAAVSITWFFFLFVRVDQLPVPLALNVGQRCGELTNEIFFAWFVPIKHLKQQHAVHVAVVQLGQCNVECAPHRIQRLKIDVGVLILLNIVINDIYLSDVFCSVNDGPRATFGRFADGQEWIWLA